MRTLAIVLLLLMADPGARPPVERAREAAADLSATLSATLTAHMRQEGPASALRMCADTAQALTEAVGESHGLTIRRVTMRWRNPMDEPDDYERAVLAAFARLDSTGGLTDETEHAETIGHGEERVLRYLRPIRIRAACLTCHGRELAPGVREALEAYYPDDRATGYDEGELRGAFSVIVSLD